MDYEAIVRLYRAEDNYLEWRRRFPNRDKMFAFVSAAIDNKPTGYNRISVDIALPLESRA